MTVDRGHCILVEEPYTHILLQSQRGDRCDWCLLRSSSLKKCTACGFLQYCNRQCQKRDWTVHKSECLCLKTVLPKIPMDSVRLMLRLVLCKNLQLPTNSMWSRTFDDLMTHEAEIKADPERAQMFAKVMFTLNEYAGTHVTLPEAKELFKVFCKMTINSFTICDGELQGIGTAIYLSGSLLDHSCQPNAVATFQGTSLVVRATERIADPAPEKIFISYIEQLGTNRERRSQLAGQYYFTCTCGLCQDTERDESMRGLCCHTVNCDGRVCLDDSNEVIGCTKCGKKSLTDEQKQKTMETVTVCQERVKQLDEMKKTEDPSSRYKMCMKYLGDVEGVLHDMNIDHVRLCDHALDAAIDSEHWDTALKYGKRTLAPYRFYYPEYSPNLAVQLFKVGKLQLYLGQLSEARRSLQEAGNILAVTHGTDHATYTGLTQTLHQCEEELRVQLENADT